MRVHPRAFPALLTLLLASCAATPPTSDPPPPTAELPRASAMVSAEPSAGADEPLPSGQLAFLRNGELIVRDMTSGTESESGVVDFIPLAFAVNSTQLVGTRLDPTDPYHVTLESHPVAGGDARVLVQALPNYGPPVASPDGTHLVFGSDGVPPNGLVLVDLATGEARQLTADGGHSPAWSPDGATLAYVRTADTDGADLFIADVASGATRQLTGDEWEDVPFGWTPDGAAVLTTSHRGGDGTRLAMSAWQVDAIDGTLTARPDLEDPVLSFSLASPDGRFFARLSPQNILSLTEGELRVGNQLESTDLSVHLTWAPNSSWLVWTSWDAEGGAHDLMIVHAPDGEPMRLTNTPEGESHPVWGPSRHGF